MKNLLLPKSMSLTKTIIQESVGKNILSNFTYGISSK